MYGIFQLLGMILDDISEESIFLFDWQDEVLVIECNNCNVVNDFILPICEGKIGQQYLVLENCEWFYATIEIATNHITRIVFTTNSGDNVVCEVESEIYVDIGWKDDAYYKICQAIVDTAQIV